MRSLAVARHAKQGAPVVEQLGNRLLHARNAQLETANRELVLRDEQIARQNEELDRRRRAAEEASGRKSRLLASVSHDIRTPVNAIGLLAEIIRRTADDPAPTTRVVDSAQRIQASVRQAFRTWLRSRRRGR